VVEKRIEKWAAVGKSASQLTLGPYHKSSLRESSGSVRFVQPLANTEITTWAPLLVPLGASHALNHLQFRSRSKNNSLETPFSN
jgi:hypothetical protein